MSSQSITWDRGERHFWQITVWLLRPLHLALAFPSVFYMAAMTVFLFRPPDLFSYYADRVAFGVLVFFVALRGMALRERIPFFPALSVPMLGLTALAVFRALREPFDPQVWSIIASKYIVPFALFHVVVLVFRNAPARRHFEIFILLVLAFSFSSLLPSSCKRLRLSGRALFLTRAWVFHADRARGPFLQAVANGVSLNMLGILAFALPRSYRRYVWLLWFVLPLAVLATMTRASGSRSPCRCSRWASS